MKLRKLPEIKAKQLKEMEKKMNAGNSNFVNLTKIIGRLKESKEIQPKLNHAMKIPKSHLLPSLGRM